MNELVINLVTIKWRKGSDTPCQKGKADSKRYWFFTAFPFVVQSGESKYLRGLFKVKYMKHGKSDDSHSLEMNGILPVRKGEESADMGCWRKRMPGSKSPDRGCYE